MDKNAKWITNETFYNLKALNIFHKEHDRREKNYDTELLNTHVLFRKKFTVVKKDSNYKISITADDYYRLYINGKFVCSGPAPCYPWCYYYNDIDITKHIVDGENTIAVHTYYQGLINRVWVSADRQQGLICTVYEDETPIVISDETFKCSIHNGFRQEGIGVHHDTFFNELFISGTENESFETCDFDDSEWEYAKARVHHDYVLCKQPTKTLDYYTITPKTIDKVPGGLRIDIGQEIIGYITIRAKGIKGERITLKYAEELNDDGSLRYDMRCNCHYVDAWILSGNTDCYQPFDYKGFRYVEITTDSECTFDVESIKIIVRHYPFVAKTECPINDPDIQKIWKLCKNTIKYGTQECFVDCPTREKGQYLGDVGVSAVSNAILTQNTDMLKKSLKNFADSRVICQGIMAVSTSSYMQEIADFSLIFPNLLLWYHKLSGDIEFLKENIDVITGLVGYFKKYERKDKLLECVDEKWNLVDWPDNLRDDYDFVITNPVKEGCHNVINALYIGMLKSVNKIYELCGLDKMDIHDHEKSFISEFYNEDLMLFTDTAKTKHTALHSNVLPLLFNIGINEECKNNIIDLIKEKSITSCGTYFSYYVLEALKRAGEKEIIIELIKDKGAWLNMLSEGATTTYEAWGKDQKKNASLFHPWSCAPIMILYDL